MADYIPAADDQLVTWLSNYKAKIATYGVSLGLTAADVTAQQALCDTITTKIQAVNAQKQNLANLVADKDTAKTTSLLTMRGKVKIMKANAAYTEAKGLDMGVISGGGHPDPNTIQIEYTLERTPLGVQVNFKKHGAESVHVYSRPAGTPAWIFLANDTHSPYVDSRPTAPAQNREYMLRAVVNDTEVGVDSAILSIAVA